jgi:hypothetical protein
VQSRYRKKNLQRNSLTKNKNEPKKCKTWYFVCPNCGKASIVVTEFLAVPCGGKWCRGLVDLKANQIPESEYKRRWCID